MEKVVIIGVLLVNRTSTASKFQEVITKHGCSIKTRIGLHTVTTEKCSTEGVILLETTGTEQEIKELEDSIKTVPGAQVQKMIFNVE